MTHPQKTQPMRLFLLEICGDYEEAIELLNLHYPDVVPLLFQVIPTPRGVTHFLYRSTQEVKPTKWTHK